MNILHILRDFGLTGVPRLLSMFISQDLWKNYGVEHYVFATHGGPLIQEIKKNAQIHCLNKKLKFSPSPIFYLSRFCNKNKIDILHIHSNPWGIIFAVFSKKPSVITFHVAPVFIGFEGIIMKICINILKNRENVKFVAVSESIKHFLVNNIRINDKKIIRIYNGINISHKRIVNFNSKLQETLCIGSVGSLSEAKGHKYLIKSIPIIKKKIPNIKCFIVGDGPLKNDLKKMIEELDLSNNVFLIGLMNFEEFVERFSPNIYVLPSIHETFGLTILEAWNYDLPVVASGVEGPKEIINSGESGLLFDAEDENDLAKKIISIHTNISLRKRIISNARARLKNFDIRQTALLYYKVYKTLMGAY